MVILDVWGGHRSMDHVARYVVNIDEALTIAKHELEKGFLINLRKELLHGNFVNFDSRNKDVIIN